MNWERSPSPLSGPRPAVLPKQPGKKGVRLAVGFWFWVIGDLRLGAVRGTFNYADHQTRLILQVACLAVLIAA